MQGENTPHVGNCLLAHDLDFQENIGKQLCGIKLLSSKKARLTYCSSLTSCTLICVEEARSAVLVLARHAIKKNNKKTHTHIYI